MAPDSKRSRKAALRGDLIPSRQPPKACTLPLAALGYRWQARPRAGLDVLSPYKAGCCSSKTLIFAISWQVPKAHHLPDISSGDKTSNSLPGFASTSYGTCHAISLLRTSDREMNGSKSRETAGHHRAMAQEGWAWSLVCRTVWPWASHSQGCVHVMRDHRGGKTSSFQHFYNFIFP